MKFYKDNEEVIVTFGDHFPGCESCRSVYLSASSTFANACAVGSPLLMEELARRQAPVEKQKRAEVEKWARERGTFIKEKSRHVQTKYKA